MANRPEDNIDRVLKRYADQRRKDTPSALKMPPATRQALRAEVARTFRDSSVPPAWLRFFLGFWPRLALGGGLIVALALLALFSFNSDRQMAQHLELAQNITEEGALTAPVPPQSAASDQNADLHAPASALRSAPEPSAGISQSGESRVARATETLARESFGLNLGRSVSNVAASAPLSFSPVTESGSALTLAAPKLPQNPAGGGFAPVQMEPDSDRTRLDQLAEKASPGAGQAASAESTLRFNPERNEAPVLANPEAILTKRTEEPPPVLGVPIAVAQPPATASATVSGTTAPVLLGRSREASRYSVPGSTQSYSLQTQPFQYAAGAEAKAQRLFFNQVNQRTQYRRNFNSPAVPKVLTRFEIQRQGGNLVVIDADGSEYQGTIGAISPTDLQLRSVAALNESAAKTPKTKSAQRDGQIQDQRGATLSASAEAAVENLPFRAEGTNRSLKQKVVFTGKYLNQAPPNERIEGNVSLGGSSFEIEAVRVRP